MFIDQKEYKEEWYDGSFTLEDIDEAFFDKVIAVYYSSSSGMGGPGVVRLLTSENGQYEIGMDMMKRAPFIMSGRGEWESVAANIPMLERGEYSRELHRTIYKSESEGWTYIKLKYGGEYLVRDDYVEVENGKGPASVDSEADGIREIEHPFGKLGTFLKSYGYVPKRYIYEETKKYRIYLQEEWEKYSAERERVRIRPEDVVWKPLYPNNSGHRIDDSEVGQKIDSRSVNYWGEYMLMVREDKKYDYRIMADKWTIVPQWKDRRISQDSEIECYILYCKSYSRDIEGPLRHPEPNSEANDEYKGWWTFGPYDVNDYGKFVRAHKTADEAKEEALKHANGGISYGGFNRENLLTEYPTKEFEERIIYEKYAPYVFFMDKKEEIIKLINEFVYGPHRGGEGHIIGLLADKFSISKNQAYHLKNLRLADLDAESIEFAKERLKSIGKYDDEKGLIDWPEDKTKEANVEKILGEKADV